MGMIVSIHSYRGGTGKSNLTANLATAVALTGKKVGIVDTDIQSPGIHILFGLDDKQIAYLSIPGDNGPMAVAATRGMKASEIAQIDKFMRTVPEQCQKGQ